MPSAMTTRWENGGSQHPGGDPAARGRLENHSSPHDCLPVARSPDAEAASSAAARLPATVHKLKERL
jgi:hypothetical protein